MSLTLAAPHPLGLALAAALVLLACDSKTTVGTATPVDQDTDTDSDSDTDADTDADTDTGTAACVNVVFESDWGTDVGQGDDALRDTNQAIPWSSVGDGTDPNIAVVQAAGVDLFNSTNTLAQQGWPTANALESVYTTTTSGVVNAEFLWPEIAVGEYLYLRWYWVHDGDDALGGGPFGSPHSPQFGPAGICPGAWSFNFGNLDSGGPGTFDEYGFASQQYRVMFQMQGGKPPLFFDLGSYGDGRKDRSHPDGAIALTKGAVYRFEVQILRTQQNMLNFSARVYDRDDILLYTSADFVDRQGAGSMGDDPPHDVPYSAAMDAADCLAGMMVGVGGQGSIPAGVVTYTGAFGVGISSSPCGWLGPL